MCRQDAGLNDVVTRIRQNASFDKRVQACAIPMARITRIPVQRVGDGRISLEGRRPEACQLSYVVQDRLFLNKRINTCQCYGPYLLTVRRAGNNGWVVMEKR